MDVKNLLSFPVRLDDGRMIGASGTNSDTRKYGKKELTERDQKRFENGKLEVIKYLPADAETTSKPPKPGKNLSEGEKTKVEANNQK